MSDSWSRLDAIAQAELVRSEQVSPRELVEAAIVRLERINPKLNAVIHVRTERARQRAGDPALPKGPLRGVPFLLKDNGAPEAGEPNHSGMRALKEANYLEAADGYLTQRFANAGLVSLGRTNTPELVLLPTTEPQAYGITHNPWNFAFSSGGSSGGSAAAVAAGIVPMAHASDGGGSIRGPSSACGLIGLKPTRGRISPGPAAGERWSGLSTEFVMTRSVRDAALMLDLASGAMPGDPYTAPPPAKPFAEALRTPAKALRIGVMRKAPRDMALHTDCLHAADHIARALESLGHHVEEAYPSALDEQLLPLMYFAIVAVNIARTLETAGEKIGRTLEANDVELLTWTMAELGRKAPAPQYLAAIEYAHGLGRRLASWWQGGFDLLLTPTMSQPPTALGLLTSTPEEPLRAILRAAPYGIFTLPFNLSGQPAMSVPAYNNQDGLPIGVQLVAASGRDDLLLNVAAQLEQFAPWADRYPVL